MDLMLQPRAANSVASQSSSSGCVGASPCRPKSLGVATMPRPKCPCHAADQTVALRPLLCRIFAFDVPLALRRSVAPHAAASLVFQPFQCLRAFGARVLGRLPPHRGRAELDELLHLAGDGHIAR